jgi:serine/threonine protein phosphatase PrpC
MAFLTASISQAGGRTVNEDNAGFLEIGSAGCWVVADGLGGHGGGATASHLAVDAVLSSFQANPSVTADALRGYLATAQAAIQAQQGEPGLSQMRSTIVVLLANERTAVCGHIGDSRLYQFRSGAVAFQTVDHSVPGSLAAAGSIAYDQIRFHEDRNRVLRSLGNNADLNPAITERPLSPGDTFLLCTDGFWEYVTEFEMEADSAKAPAPADWLRFMGSRLLSRAKPDHDNYTALAVVFRSPAAPMPAPRERSGPAADRSAMSLSEKLAWVAFACLTVTLLIFVAVGLFPDPLAGALAKRHWFSPAPAGNGGKRAAEPQRQVNYGKFEAVVKEGRIAAELSFHITPPLGHQGCAVLALTGDDGKYVEQEPGRRFQLAQDFKGDEDHVTVHFDGPLPRTSPDPTQAQAVLFANPCRTEGDPVLSKSALVPLWNEQ